MGRPAGRPRRRADARRPPPTRPRSSSSRRRPLEPVVDLDRAIDPGAARARLERVVADGGRLRGIAACGGRWRRGGVHAGRAGLRQRDPSQRVPARRRRDGARGQRRRSSKAGSRRAGSTRATSSPRSRWPALDDDGILHVTAATQGTFYTRSELAKLFGRSIASVRVTGATIGGGFGGKTLVLDPLVAAAALALRRPVRLELTRLEDFRMTNPAPAAILDVRLGATNDGRFRALGGPAPFRDRRLRGQQHRGDRGDPDGRAVPLGRSRSRRLRRRDEPARDGDLSGSRRPAGDLRPRTARRRAGSKARDRPDRAAPTQPRGRRTTRWRTGRRGAASASPNAWNASPPIRSVAPGRRCPTARASGWPSGRGPAVASRPRRSAASRRTGGSPS